MFAGYIALKVGVQMYEDDFKNYPEIMNRYIEHLENTIKGFQLELPDVLRTYNIRERYRLTYKFEESKQYQESCYFSYLVMENCDLVLPTRQQRDLMNDCAEVAIHTYFKGTNYDEKKSREKIQSLFGEDDQENHFKRAYDLITEDEDYWYLLPGELKNNTDIIERGFQSAMLSSAYVNWLNFIDKEKFNNFDFLKMINKYESLNTQYIPEGTLGARLRDSIGLGEGIERAELEEELQLSLNIKEKQSKDLMKI